MITRTRFERFFPQLDLAGIRIHTDAHADRWTRAHGADAITLGPDILFRAGRFDPVSRKGLTLIGHELTHVLQSQAAGGPAYANSRMDWEREAVTVEHSLALMLAAPAVPPAGAAITRRAAVSGGLNLVHAAKAGPPVSLSGKEQVGGSVAMPSTLSGATAQVAVPGGNLQPLKAEEGRAEALTPPAATNSTGPGEIESLPRELMRMMELRIMIERERRGVDRWAR